MNKHTPGPWMLDPSLPLMVYCDDDLGSRIADCSNPGRLIDMAHAKANARLIAAAPDLLKALQDVVAHLDYLQAGDEQTINPITHQRACDAIAKATADNSGE